MIWASPQMHACGVLAITLVWLAAEKDATASIPRGSGPRLIRKVPLPSGGLRTGEIACRIIDGDMRILAPTKSGIQLWSDRAGWRVVAKDVYFSGPAAGGNGVSFARWKASKGAEIGLVGFNGELVLQKDLPALFNSNTAVAYHAADRTAFVFFHTQSALRELAPHDVVRRYGIGFEVRRMLPSVSGRSLLVRGASRELASVNRQTGSVFRAQGLGEVLAAEFSASEKSVIALLYSTSRVRLTKLSLELKMLSSSGPTLSVGKTPSHFELERLPNLETWAVLIDEQVLLGSIGDEVLVPLREVPEGAVISYCGDNRLLVASSSAWEVWDVSPRAWPGRDR